jgi:proteasome accessory factor B
MPARSKKKPAKQTRARYGAAQRLLELRRFLATPHGASLEQIVERFACSRHTAMRMVAALQATGEPIEEERDGRRNVYRSTARAAATSFKPTIAHVIAIAVARQVLDFLEGTTIAESFDDVVAQFEGSLGRKAFASFAGLERKILVMQDAPYAPADRSDSVDAILTALEREERLRVRRMGGAKERAFDVDPYTLVLFKKGLYLTGFSHHHQSVRTFSVDGFADVEWKRGERFAYPAEWRPRDHHAGSFGLFDGPETRVVVEFSPKVAKYVVRRSWHPSQRVEEHADGRVVLTLKVRGTTEIVSWVLGFGEHARVLAPGKLRDELAVVTAAMAKAYAD